MVKTCSTCKKTKDVSFFYRSNVRYYQRECKVCCKIRKRAWHQTDSGKLSSANTKLKRRFGITLDEYNRLLKKQGSRCLICWAKQSVLGHRLAVDHDHATGAIRGLLCKSCNIGIGHLQDNPLLCERAAAYLLKSGNLQKPEGSAQHVFNSQ